MLLHRHRQLGGETIAVGRCAIQIGGLGLELEWLARLQYLLRGIQIELHALGQELLDAQGHALHRFLAGRIGAEFHLPAPGRRLGGNELFETEITLCARLQAGFAEGLAVRLLQAQEYRLRLGRLAVVVAQQGVDAHGFAGAIQIATRPCEHVEPGGLAPGDREFGQVQRRLVERQHRHVLATAGDQHMARVELVVEQGIAVAVGLAFQRHLALRVEDLQFHPAHGVAAVERGGMHEQLVLVGARMQADVADGEERGLEIAGELAGALHHREVEAGLLQLLDVLGRQVGQQAFVGLAAQQEAVDVDRLGQVAERGVVAVLAVQVPAAATAAALVFGKELGQVLLGDAQELDVHFLDVDRHHRQAAAFARRQHAALRGEAHRRVELAGMDLFLQFLAQAAAVGGQQVGAHQHFIVLGRFHVREAQDQALVIQYPAALDRGALVVGDGQQLVEILRAHQRAAEFQGDGKVAVVLVRIDAGQGEALDLLLLRLDRFAAGRGQLPGLIALAGAQRQQHEQ